MLLMRHRDVNGRELLDTCCLFGMELPMLSELAYLRHMQGTNNHKVHHWPNPSQCSCFYCNPIKYKYIGIYVSIVSPLLFVHRNAKPMP